MCQAFERTFLSAETYEIQNRTKGLFVPHTSVKMRASDAHILRGGFSEDGLTRGVHHEGEPRFTAVSSRDTADACVSPASGVRLGLSFIT